MHAMLCTRKIQFLNMVITKLSVLYMINLTPKQSADNWRCLDVYFDIFEGRQKTADSFLQFTTNVLANYKRDISVAHIFTDGPSSQNKNR